MRITDEAVKAASNYIALGIDKSSAPRAIAENALAAALPHLQADYAVKQLEWGKLLYTEDYSFMQNAETSIGKYVATDSGWFLQGQSDWNGADCIETAKAAAQADYERRVCECIDGGVAVAEVRRKALDGILRELSGNTGKLIDMMVSAIRADGGDLCDGAWEDLGDDRKIAWRGDAKRALAAVKEYLTTRATTPAAPTTEEEQ